jgi:hypothetical protein
MEMCSPAGNDGVGRSEGVRVWLLGGFRISVGPRTIEHDQWRLRKAAALVKLLALTPGHSLHREQAMDALWPDSSRKAVSNNLRQTLHAARRALDPSLGSQYLVSEEKQLTSVPARRAVGGCRCLRGSGGNRPSRQRPGGLPSGPGAVLRRALTRRPLWLDVFSQLSVIHVQSLCQLADGGEARVNLVVLDTNQAAQGYSGTLSEFGLRQQPILSQPPEIFADLHDLNCRHLSPHFLGIWLLLEQHNETQNLCL